MFGGRTKRAHVSGAKASGCPLVAFKDPVSIMDLHATIFTKMGISPMPPCAMERCPFSSTEAGDGKPVMILFS